MINCGWFATYGKAVPAFCEVAQAALVNIGGYGSTQPGTIVSNFRITARGEGQTAGIYRYLQSYFGKEF